MTNGSVNGMRVAILLGDNFEQVEMTDPRQLRPGRPAPSVRLEPADADARKVRAEDTALLPDAMTSRAAVALVDLASQFDVAGDRLALRAAGSQLVYIKHQIFQLILLHALEGRHGGAALEVEDRRQHPYAGEGFRAAVQ